MNSSSHQINGKCCRYFVKPHLFSALLGVICAVKNFLETYESHLFSCITENVRISRWNARKVHHLISHPREVAFRNKRLFEISFSELKSDQALLTRNIVLDEGDIFLGGVQQQVFTVNKVSSGSRALQKYPTLFDFQKPGINTVPENRSDASGRCRFLKSGRCSHQVNRYYILIQLWRSPPAK